MKTELILFVRVLYVRVYQMFVIDVRDIIRKFKREPRTSAPKLATMLEEERGITVHPENVRRVLRAEGYNGRIARKKPYINARNRKKRLQYAKEYIAKEDEW